MSNWVKRTRQSARRKQKEAELDADFEQIAGWLAEHPNADVPPEKDQSAFAQGYRAFDKHCSSCHSYKGQGGGETKAPDMTGYGGEDWVRLMVMGPASERRYGSHNTMPAFRDLDGPTAEMARLEFQYLKDRLREQSAEDGKQAMGKQAADAATKLMNLSDIDRELIIRWLLKDDRVVFGGEPISAPPAP
jgi:mono/diheme cytochrome c family protein